MDDQFPLIEDKSKKKAPPDVSAEKIIDTIWETVRQRILDGLPYGQEVRNAENYLAKRKNHILQSALNSEFDWNYDYAMAIFKHGHNTTWISTHEKIRNLSLDRWQKTIDQMTEFLLSVVGSGFKTILLVHGAAAVGALNVMIQNPAKTGVILLISKIVLICAIVGISAVGIGQLVFINVMSKTVGKLRYKLAANPSWLALRAMHRYFYKMNKRSQWGDILIYSSVFWFCIYSLGAAVFMFYKIGI